MPHNVPGRTIPAMLRRREFGRIRSALSSSTHIQAPGVKEYVYAVLGPGSYFGLATAVRRAAFTAEARAFGATDLAVFTAAELLGMLEERPLLWKHISS